MIIRFEDQIVKQSREIIYAFHRAIHVLNYFPYITLGDLQASDFSKLDLPRILQMLLSPYKNYENAKIVSRLLNQSHAITPLSITQAFFDQVLPAVQENPDKTEEILNAYLLTIKDNLKTMMFSMPYDDDLENILARLHKIKEIDLFFNTQQQEIEKLLNTLPHLKKISINDLKSLSTVLSKIAIGLYQHIKLMNDSLASFEQDMGPGKIPELLQQIDHMKSKLKTIANSAYNRITRYDTAIVKTEEPVVTLFLPVTVSEPSPIHQRPVATNFETFRELLRKKLADFSKKGSYVAKQTNNKHKSYGGSFRLFKLEFSKTDELDAVALLMEYADTGHHHYRPIGVSLKALNNGKLKKVITDCLQHSDIRPKTINGLLNYIQEQHLSAQQLLY